MTVESRKAGEDPRRYEAARQAVRAVASAYRTLRLYPLGHALTTEALQAARRAIDDYSAAFGSLTVRATPRGVTFDFSPRPYADDVVADLTRAMRARAAPAVRFLQAISPVELGELLGGLHQPIQEIERAGGIGKVLKSRGVQHVVIQGLGTGAPVGVDLLEPLLEAVKSGTADRIADYLEQTGGDQELVRNLFRSFDQRIAAWPRAAQAAAWKAVGQTLASLEGSWQAGVCAMVVQSVDEPWAATLVSQWPPVLAAGLAAQGETDAQERGRRVAEAIRAFHRPIPRIRLPAPPQLTAAELREAADDLAAWPPPRLRAQAMGRLLELLPTMDTARFDASLDDLMEHEIVAAVEERDVQSLVAMVRGLSKAVGSLDNTHRDRVLTALRRLITVGGRHVFEGMAGQPPGPEHPFVQMMQVAPDETIGLLLKLAGEEERVPGRRAALDLLVQLSSGRADLMRDHVVDPRWHIACAAVTILGRIAGPEAMPYLRTALGHADIRVRRETLRAIAGLQTSEAMEALAEALLKQDGETQAAAAHWLGVVGRPEAAGILITVLEGSPLVEQVEVKREVIRALGRLGTAEAIQALRRVAEAASPLLRRRQFDELKQEAKSVLARLGTAG